MDPRLVGYEVKSCNACFFCFAMTSSNKWDYNDIMKCSVAICVLLFSSVLNAQTQSPNKNGAHDGDENDQKELVHAKGTDSTAYIIAVSGLVSVLVSGTLTILGGYLSRKHEKDKQVRDLSIQLAIEEYRREGAAEAKIAEANHLSKLPIKFNSGGLQQKVLAMLAFADAIARRGSVSAIRKTVAEEYEKQRTGKAL